MSGSVSMIMDMELVMSDYKINDKRGKEEPQEVCRRCGSEHAHVWNYTDPPTMACIEYLREQVSELRKFVEKVDDVLSKEIGFYAQGIKTSEKVTAKGYNQTEEGGKRNKYGEGWNDCLHEMHMKLYGLFDENKVANKILEEKS